MGLDKLNKLERLELHDNNLTQVGGWAGGWVGDWGAQVVDGWMGGWVGNREVERRRGGRAGWLVDRCSSRPLSLSLLAPSLSLS